MVTVTLNGQFPDTVLSAIKSQKEYESAQVMSLISSSIKSMLSGGMRQLADCVQKQTPPAEMIDWYKHFMKHEIDNAEKLLAVADRYISHRPPVSVYATRACITFDADTLDDADEVIDIIERLGGIVCDKHEVETREEKGICVLGSEWKEGVVG